MRVRVVGAGIVGLAAALRLREAGHDVEIVAAQFGDETTSAIAAALWYPYLALPERAVTRWAAAGYAALTEFSTEPASGVDLRTGRQLFREVTGDPWWISAVGSIGRVAAAQLPPGFADAIELTVPVVDMPVHLRWLTERLTARGVPIRAGRLATLEDARPGADVVLNCAGLGARELAHDRDLHAVRGQVVLVEQIGLTRWTLDESDPAELTYVVPRRDSIVLGGTALAGDDDRTVRPATARAILARASALVPELAGARVLAHRVGLRPARSAVRLERCGDVVHCYGHGGAGVTLAYGCAGDIVELLS